MLKKNNALSVVIILIFCGLSGYAQQDLNNNNTTSPYSRYGLGDLHHYGYGRTAAMGGASLGSRHSIQINSANPASFSSNDSLSFVFEFGMDAKFSNYKSNTGSMKASDLNFRYFSLSFPISKRLGAGLGLQPYSDMGNEISYSEILPNIGNVSYKYIGEGTISKAYFGASVIPFKGLSLGANLNYIFGRINQNSTTNFDDATLFDLSSTEGTRLSDFTLSYGLQYDYKIKKNQYLTLGVTFETPSDVTAFHRLLSFKTITVGSGALVDTIQFKPESKDIIKLPSTIGVGLSYNKINKLEVNADYYYAGWSKSTFYGASDPVLTNQSRFSAGFEYIPEMFSIRSYVKRIKYRAGVHHENSYLILNNHQIKETGVSIGAGIPFPKSKSTANIAFELGKQGTTKDELVQNIYTKFSIYLNLYDYWFMKRKFD
jgi:opacity protein-like surface antigen